MGSWGYFRSSKAARCYYIYISSKLPTAGAGGIGAGTDLLGGVYVLAFAYTHADTNVSMLTLQ